MLAISHIKWKMGIGMGTGMGMGMGMGWDWLLDDIRLPVPAA